MLPQLSAPPAAAQAHVLQGLGERPHAQLLHLQLVLASAQVPAWVGHCVQAWQRWPGLRLSCQVLPPAAAAAVAPPLLLPGLRFDALAPLAIQRCASAATLSGWPQPVDVFLALDDASAQWLLGQPAAARCWVLADSQGQALAADWPLLQSASRGEGLALQLLEQRVGRDGSPDTAAGWRVRRRARWQASSRYGQALPQLAGAVQQLLQQALTDLRLQPANDLPMADGPPQPATALTASAVLAALWRGRSRAWRQQQRAYWFSEYWRIGVVDAPIADYVRAGGHLPVRWITPDQRAGHWADPMGMPGRSDLLFCEYVDERTGLGQLQSLRLTPEGRVQDVQALPVGQGSHSSFPMVVRLAGRLLGLAETACLKQSLLHQVSPDGQWHSPVPILPGLSLADPALFQWQGRHWLAATDLALGTLDNLCLFHADQPEGPWLPHANNPVKTDLAGARMAGPLFMLDGQLMRPAQDCQAAYGAALVLHRVLRCTPTEYQEELVARYRPDETGPCPDGLHTLAAWGNRTLVDGKRMGLNPLVLRRKLVRRLRGGRPTLPAVAVGAGQHPAPALPDRVQHVAVYVPHLRMGGGEMSMLRLAHGFAKAGLRVDLVVHSLATAELPVPDGVQVVCLDSDGTAGALRRLAQVLRQRRPQCLLSGFPHTNVAAVAAVALARVPCHCVVSEHAPLSRQIESQANWRYRVLPPLVRWAYRRAAAVVAVSAGVRDDLRRLAGDGLRLQVIANPVLADADDPAAASALAAQTLHPWLQDPGLQVVLSVSRLSVEKDIPTLLDAFARLHQALPDTRLLLAGDGPERERLQDQVRSMGLQAVVQLPGRVAQPTVWMRQAALFVLASRYEGFGNVLVEALASGTPVVATDCPVGPREILQDGRYGRLVPVGDAAALAQAMAEALAQPVQPTGAQAHALQFTEARACAAYQALFDRLQGGAQPC